MILRIQERKNLSLHATDQLTWRKGFRMQWVEDLESELSPVYTEGFVRAGPTIPASAIQWTAIATSSRIRCAISGYVLQNPFRGIRDKFQSEIHMWLRRIRRPATYLFNFLQRILCSRMLRSILHHYNCGDCDGYRHPYCCLGNGTSHLRIQYARHQRDRILAQNTQSNE